MNTEYNKKVKILVFYHKNDIIINQEPYLPIHVGKSLHPNIELGIQCDNDGDNISDKNASYCELTGMYWAWKNLKDIDVIGLCHYRRYFDFHHQCHDWYPMKEFHIQNFNNVNLSIPNRLINNIKSGEVIVASKKYFRYSLAQHYNDYHFSNDLKSLEKIIEATQPKYICNSYRKVMYQTNCLSPYNMFIMCKNDYDKYCEWLFSILGELEKHIDISHYSDYQKRIYGYMAERLFNVYLHAFDFKLYFRPIIFFTENSPKKQISWFRYKQRCWRWTLGVKLICPRNFKEE